MTFFVFLMQYYTSITKQFVALKMKCVTCSPLDSPSLPVIGQTPTIGINTVMPVSWDVEQNNGLMVYRSLTNICLCINQER